MDQQLQACSRGWLSGIQNVTLALVLAYWPVMLAQPEGMPLLWSLCAVCRRAGTAVMASASGDYMGVPLIPWVMGSFKEQPGYLL